MRSPTLIKTLIIFSLNYLTICPSSGQTLNFKQLSTKDGLPSIECYHVIQDKEGYVWIFTEYGIVKHNGERFIPVCTNILLKDQNAYSVFQTDKGEIYFSNSFNKIFKIRNDSAFSIKAVETFTSTFTQPEDIIFQVVVDTSSNIYFSSYNASYCYDALRDNVNKMEQPPKIKGSLLVYKLINNHFFSIRSDILVSKRECNVSIEDKYKVVTSKIVANNFYEIRSLKKINGFYILGVSDNLYKIAENGITISKKISGIVSFNADRKNQIWVLTKGGLLLLDAELNIVATYLEGKIVVDICFDNKDGIWVTTISEGVFYCKNKEEIVYFNPYLKQNEILFIKKENKNIYMSSLDGNCYKFNSDSSNEIELIQHFDDNIYCGDFSKYKDGYIFTTKNGIFFKNKKGIVSQFAGPNNLIGTYSNYVKVINDNEFLVFGGISVYHFKNDKLYNYALVKNKLYCIASYDNDNYLVGTKNGIYLYNYKSNTVAAFNDFFSNKFITKLAYDRLENLWIATRGDGLFILTKDQQLIKDTNLPFFVVKDIDFFDNNGVVFSTNLGIYVNRYNETSIVNEWVNIFDDEVNALELVDKKLWVASRKGLVSLDYSSLSYGDFYPIIINSVYSGTQKVLSNSSELQYNENNLRFNFDFLNYQSKVKNFYFKLEGPTQLSGTITGNVLQIQNLAPGYYKLAVYPYHGPIYSANHFVSRSFVINPAFWQTSWFKVFMFLLVTSISGLIVALFFNRKRKREKKDSETQKLLAEHKLTSLKAQINPHFISNSLSAIQLLIDSGKVDKANQYIAKFSLLIRYVLKYSDKRVSRLSDELKIIELNVELEQLRFTNSFVFKMDVSDDIDINELYVPPLITQPFIENAIWHGLIPLTSRIPELILKIKKQDDSLIISIIDNGVGRKRTEKNTSITNSAFRDSMGTKLIQNRIDNLNAMHNTKAAEVIIRDLYDEQSNASGTQVDIILSVSLLSSF